MPRFTLTIDCNNAAFGETDGERRREVARSLRVVADRVEDCRGDGQTRDANGNCVGFYAFAEADDAADKIRDAAPDMLAALKAIAALENATKVECIGLLKRARHIAKATVANVEG